MKTAFIESSRTPPLSPARRRWMVAAAGLPWALAACSESARTSLPDLPFTQLDGSAHRLADLKGKVVLVNFWATSCATCVKEMPLLMATHRTYAAQGYDTLAIAMQYDPPAYVMNFAQSRGLPFRVAMDHDGQLAQAFGPVELTPTSFLVNRRGQIVKRYIGMPDETEFHPQIAKLLAEGVA